MKKMPIRAMLLYRHGRQISDILSHVSELNREHVTEMFLVWWATRACPKGVCPATPLLSQHVP